MDTQTSKKRTAVVAVATAAAMLLTGTFAWTLATDDTVLNPFSDTDEGAYGAELEENFDPANPWDKKEVYVKNTADNPVIVRVRLEEFYDLTSRVGSEYGVAEGYLNGDEGSSAIFTTDGLTGGAADSSTKLANAISLKFGTNVAVLTADNAANIPEGIEWLIDPVDGWCYYTRALLAGESTGFLLEDVDFFDNNFNYSQPYDLDYKINVRLQAISADLEDFGSHIKDEQWTNVGYINEAGEDVTDDPTDQGRIIAADDRADNYEITTDTPISDNALTLVVNIGNAANIYANNDTTVAVRVASAQELKDAIGDTSTHSVLLTSDITFGAGDSVINAFQNKLIDLGDYKITVADDFQYPYLFSSSGGVQLIVRNGRVDTGEASFAYVLDSGSTLKMENLTVDCCESPIGAIYVGEETKIVMNNCSVTSEISAIARVDKNAEIEVNDSTLTLAPGVDSQVFLPNWYQENVKLTVNNSTLQNSATGNTGVIWPQDGWQVNIKGSKIIGGKYGVLENYNNCPDYVYIENTDIVATHTGYYKVTDCPLTLKNCTISNPSTTVSPTNGILVRAGDVVLDNVKIDIIRGTNDTSEVLTHEATDSVYAQEDQYQRNYNPLQVILNAYRSINLTIKGGSFSTSEDESECIYVYDEPNVIVQSVDHEFVNTITIEGAPTCTGGLESGKSFASSYINTTVTVK